MNCSPFPVCTHSQSHWQAIFGTTNCGKIKDREGWQNTEYSRNENTLHIVKNMAALYLTRSKIIPQIYLFIFERKTLHWNNLPHSLLLNQKSKIERTINRRENLLQKLFYTGHLSDLWKENKRSCFTGGRPIPDAEKAGWTTFCVVALS